MNNKGFESEITLDETPSFRVTENKPLKTEDKVSKTVDINVLKARAQRKQDLENRKNILIFVFLLSILGIIGIYFSI
jgi:hypothetical protein|tara:strand:+ start:226 stop:456 length:231 start_codon:yes stop_codon:yes gene_type:complete